MNDDNNNEEEELVGRPFPRAEDGPGVPYRYYGNPGEQRRKRASATDEKVYLRFGTHVVAQDKGRVLQQLATNQLLRDARVSDTLNGRGMVSLRVFSVWASGESEGVDKIKQELVQLVGGHVFRLKGSIAQRAQTGRGVRKTVKVASWNVNWLAGKLKQIQGAIETERPGIFCLQETMFRSDHSALRWAGYDTVVMDPNAAESNRGLVIGTRKDDGWLLNRVMPERKHSLVAMATGIRKDEGDRVARAVKVAVVNVYLSHHRKREASAELAKIVKKLQKKNSIDEIVVMGDFNCSPGDVARWDAKHGAGLYRAKMSGPTRFRRSSRRAVAKFPIDHILTKQRQVEGANKAGQWPFSDHLMITMNVRMPEVEKVPVVTRIDGTDWANGDDDMGDNAEVWDADKVLDESLGSFIADGVWAEATRCGRTRSKASPRAWHTPRVRKAANKLRQLSSNRFAVLESDEAMEAEDESFAQKRDADESYAQIKLARKQLRKELKVEKTEQLRKGQQRQL